MSQALSTANVKDPQTCGLEGLDEVFLPLLLAHWSMPAECQPAGVLSHLPRGFRWCDLLPKGPTQPVSSALWPGRGAGGNVEAWVRGALPSFSRGKWCPTCDPASALRLLCISTYQTGERPADPHGTPCVTGVL